MPPRQRPAPAVRRCEPAPDSRQPDGRRSACGVRFMPFRRDALRPRRDRQAGAALAGGAWRAVRACAAPAGGRDPGRRRHKPHMVPHRGGQAFGGVPPGRSEQEKSFIFRLHSQPRSATIRPINGKVYFSVHFFVFVPPRCALFSLPFVVLRRPSHQQNHYRPLRNFPRNVE